MGQFAAPADSRSLRLSAAPAILNAYTVDEGGNVVVTVILSADPEREVVIPITVESGGTATSTDYSD